MLYSRKRTWAGGTSTISGSQLARQQKDKVGRPDIDSFEAVMTREDRTKGFFVGFDYSDDALREIDNFLRKSGEVIVALMVRQVSEEGPPKIACVRCPGVNRRQEEWCLERLEFAVLSEHPGAHLHHQRGCEPPDFWLDVNGRRFAVEVSTIRVECGQTYWQSLCRLVRHIESDAIAAGELSGRYVVGACAALPRGAQARNTLAESIRAYLRETRTMCSSPPRELVVDGVRFGDIRKYAAERARLHLMGGLTDEGAFQAEISDELQELLDCCISRKRMLLSKCKHPRVLVLYDCYGLEDETAAFVQRVKDSPDASFFHAVFLIHSNGDEVLAHGCGGLVE